MTFKNRIFYFLLLVYIVLLLLYNIFISVKYNSIYGVIPIIIQGALLFSILYKAKYAKLFILIWSIVFILIGSALQIIGNMPEDFAGTFSNANIYKLLEQLVSIIIAVLIISYTQSTVAVEYDSIVE